MEFPEDLRYTKEHEWVRDEGGGRVRVGITDYAQDALGDVVYVDVPEVGTEVTANQPFSEVESTKSVSDVYAPVSGTVIERQRTARRAARAGERAAVRRRLDRRPRGGGARPSSKG